MKLRTLLLTSLLSLAGLLCAAQAASSAEDWPGTKPLRFEVGSAAGGVLDFVARELANHLSASIGVPVVVENRLGAGGNIAAGVVAKALPDGHTLLFTGSKQVVNPTLLPNPGFDYERDFTPVSMVVSVKMLLAASPSFPGKTIADVIAMAKQKPGAVSIAIGAIGTPPHLAAEMLAQYENINLTFVPYDGVAQTLPDLMANRVDLAVGALSTMLPHVRSGALKALAMIGPQRSALAPDLPTSAEEGFPEIQIDAWMCILATGGTPASVVTRLDQEFAKTLALPEVRDIFTRRGLEIIHLNPQQLGDFLHSESTRYAGLLKHSRY